MKKISVFLFFLIPILGWSQSFDSVVNFDLELSTLSDRLIAGKAAEDGRIIILEVLVSGSEKAESEEDLIVTLAAISKRLPAGISPSSGKFLFNCSSLKKTRQE